MKTLSGALVLAVAALAQPPVKPVPAAGIEVPAADRAELQAGLAHLRESIGKLKSGPLLPDVLIYHEAVRYALQYNEFFKPAEIAAAKTPAPAGRGSRRPTGRRTGAVDHGHRTRGPRLRL